MSGILLPECFRQFIRTAVVMTDRTQLLPSICPSTCISTRRNIGIATSERSGMTGQDESDRIDLVEFRN